NPREWQFGWYFRDRYQATRNLTLNFGLRYEYFPFYTRAAAGAERLDPDTNTVLLGRRGGLPDHPGIRVSKKLFAPRFGYAYRWRSKTVLRGGYGMSNDPIPLSRVFRGFFPFTIAQTFVGANSFVPFRPLTQGIPDFGGPDISSGRVQLDPTAEERTPPNGLWRRGYIQSWNFTVERQLPMDLVGTVAYVGTQTVRQVADLNINAAAPGTGQAGRPFFAPFGRTANTLLNTGFLSANYHALQTSINRRFRRG